MSAETKQQLRQRITQLESELGHYMDIAHWYRSALGDVKANQIIGPFLAERKRREREPREQPDWQAALAAARIALKPTQPHPAPPGGTPEVDAAIVYCDLMTPEDSPVQYADMVPVDLARTLERQRNEARAALASAQAEVEAARVVVESMNTELKAGMAAMVQFDKERATLRAELEQTRRVRDSLGVGYDEMHDELYSALGMHLTCAAEIDALRQALTAAEQRASGAEKERDGYRTALEQARLEIQILLSK